MTTGATPAVGHLARPPRRVLPVIVSAQFAGTSLWFAGNAVLGDLQAEWTLGGGTISAMTSAVQLGFIFGTLVFALLAIADRLPAHRVFLVSSLLAAGCNAGTVALDGGELFAFLALRFGVGFFLAGVYPVGMKLAASWYRPAVGEQSVGDQRLGRALSFLVAALVLGTAFPHLVRALGSSLPWRSVMLLVSLIAVAGGVAMVLLVPEGSRLRDSPSAVATTGPRPGLDLRSLVAVFRIPAFRASTLGYFGHQWELYAMWAFVPVIVGAHLSAGEGERLAAGVPAWSFAVIAAGAIGSVGGGLLAPRLGSARVAVTQLAISGLCCLLLPLLFLAPAWLFFPFLLMWGVSAVGDSPQYSALNASAAPPAQVGSALTLVVSLGFGLKVGSIELLGALSRSIAPRFFGLPLLLGPIIGLLAMRPLLAKRQSLAKRSLDRSRSMS